MTIIDMAREMGKAVQQTDEYRELMAARLMSDNDKELQSKIARFSTLRGKLEMQTEDDGSADSLNEELMQLYSDIMANENMQSFEAARDAMDGMMNTVTAILSAAVNGENPETYEPEASGCGGDCCGCSGCH